VLIDVEDFHGISERGVKQELFAHFVLITLSRIFANKVDNDINKKENSQSKGKLKTNLKNSLITIARNLENLFLQQEALVKKTINTIINTVATCYQRERPNRSYERVSKKPVRVWKPTTKKTYGSNEATVS